MLDFKKIIKEETESCQTTTFISEDGKSTYRYVILPFESRMTLEFQEAIIQEMINMLVQELKAANVILLPEAKAFLLSPIARETRKDLVLIRKRDYRVPDQIVIQQEKAYVGKSLMYCVGLEKGDRPLILDDIVSSGGTEIAIIRSLKVSEFKIAGAGTVYERGNGIETVKKETGYSVKGLVRLELMNDRPHIPRFYTS
ncbi:phosphoribosyltransferase family protein [[Eubacterium] cellulosolvens]